MMEDSPTVMCARRSTEVKTYEDYSSILTINIGNVLNIFISNLNIVLKNHIHTYNYNFDSK